MAYSMSPDTAARLPSPVDLVRAGFRLVEFQLEIAREVLLLPARVVALVDSAEEIVARVQRLLDEAGRAVEAVDKVIVFAAQTVDEAREIVRGAGAVVVRVEGTVDSADHVVARVSRTVDSADHVVGHVSRTVDSADRVVARVDRTIDSADVLVGRAVPLLDFAESAVAPVRPVVEALLVDADLDPEEARRVAGRLTEVLAWSDSVVTRLAPIADQVIDSVDPTEVRALVELIDHLPALTKVLETDVIPVLSSLDSVAPEVHEILAVAQKCLEAISGIPGFNLLRRRGEDKVEDHTENPGES